MSPLTQLLADRITREGPLPFAELMEAALYHPEHGYYTSGRAKIGRGGDYFTNVSVGPLFARLLVRQFAEMWKGIGCPTQFTVVEQGAHGGDFALDAMEGARELEPEFATALRYTIIEPSARLAAAQRERLSPWGEKFAWVDLPGDLALFDGVHFSNELLDAFPVHTIVFRQGAWHERRVGWEEGRFLWSEAPLANAALQAHVARLPRDLPEGYATEVNLHTAPWLQALSEKLRRGWILAIDYGYPRAEYYRPERTSGTLSAYARHKRVDNPLSTPGEIDLTAHADFTTLAEAAHAAGLEPAGFADQHHFMAGLARLHFRDTEEITPALEKENRAFKTLMHPNFLGSSFKAICFAKAVAAPLSGFAFAREKAVL